MNLRKLTLLHLINRLIIYAFFFASYLILNWILIFISQNTLIFKVLGMHPFIHIQFDVSRKLLIVHESFSSISIAQTGGYLIQFIVFWQFGLVLIIYLVMYRFLAIRFLGLGYYFFSSFFETIRLDLFLYLFARWRGNNYLISDFFKFFEGIGVIVNIGSWHLFRILSFFLRIS